jgi:molybdenum cofactor cytidylyltransferase
MATTDGGSFVSGVVLAAGASTRMGRPKQLLPVGDRCLLRRVLDAALASRLDEVIVVLGHRADEIRDALALDSLAPDAGGRARVVVNSEHADGQSTSLRCGLRAADERAQAVAVLLGDQPAVGAELIDRVVAAFLAAAAPLARPVYPDAGGAPGHPVLLARRIWPELDGLTGDGGARALMAARPEWLLEVAVAGQPPADVDTLEDYQRVASGYGTGRRATPPSSGGRPKRTR